LAEQGEAGAAVHLALDHLDLGDVAFEGGGAVGQRQPGGDGLLVQADAPGEGVQVGLVVGFDGGEPGLECEEALAVGHQLGDGPGEGGRVGAGGGEGGEPGLPGGVQAGGGGQQPAGDLAGLGDGRGGRGRAGGPAGSGPAVGGAELGDVALDGAQAAGPAQG